MTTTIYSGAQILDNQFKKTYIVTSVTDKRINLDEPNNKYTTSTGRSSSKFFVGHERFSKYIETGKWEVIK